MGCVEEELDKEAIYLGLLVEALPGQGEDFILARSKIVRVAHCAC